MEKKIMNYFVNWSIDNATDKKLPYDMDTEIENAIHTYLRNYNSNQDYNKARAFEYLRKIIVANLYDSDKYDFEAILTEDCNTVITYAGGFAGYDTDYIIVVFHQGLNFNIYAFRTYNECDTFTMFEYESED